MAIQNISISIKKKTNQFLYPSVGNLISISRRELFKLFASSENVKHRLMLTMIYASGLRRNELLNL